MACLDYSYQWPTVNDKCFDFPTRYYSIYNSQQGPKLSQIFPALKFIINTVFYESYFIQCIVLKRDEYNMDAT